MTTVHVVVPAGIDDPHRPSGGNRYDRRICAGLAAEGWDLRELPAAGRWPHPDATALAALASAIATVPDDGLLLVDGLIAAAARTVLVPQSRRLREVVLVHMPLGGVEVPTDDERAVLTHARGVVTTSGWTRARLLEHYPLDADRVAVARPGTEPGAPANGTEDGGRLLCVGAVASHKGQDVLVEALAGLTCHTWACRLVGPLDQDPAFVHELRARIGRPGLAERITLEGPQDEDRLRALYAAADLLVLPTRLEAYGMVVTEALARGVPVLASDVGGVPEALGTTRQGAPGLLVPPGDPAALREALRTWLDDAALRAGLRRAARERRAHLPGWDATIRAVSAVLDRVAAEPERLASRVVR